MGFVIGVPAFLAIILITSLFFASLTYIVRSVILVRFYIKSAYPQADALLSLYTLFAIVFGVVAVYFAKCEYEAITKK